MLRGGGQDHFLCSQDGDKNDKIVALLRLVLYVLMFILLKYFRSAGFQAPRVIEADKQFAMYVFVEALPLNDSRFLSCLIFCCFVRSNFLVILPNPKRSTTHIS